MMVTAGSHQLRSGAAVREDAEFVALWVGEHDPALIPLADVGVPGTRNPGDWHRDPAPRSSPV